MIEEIAILGALGFIFAFGLVVASRKLAVKMDERVEMVRNLLPGRDCGACGFSGCYAYASAVANSSSSPPICKQLEKKDLDEVGKLLGIDLKPNELVAKLCCRAGSKLAFDYRGAQSCAIAAGVAGGFLECKRGCLGLGDCFKICPFDAIRMVNGLPEIDEDKCTGCGQCVKICPKGVLKLLPKDTKIILRCNSTESAKVKTRICKNGCIACGICEQVCPVHAIKMVNNLPEIDQAVCTACGLCVEKCPRHVLEIERPANAASAETASAQVST